MTETYSLEISDHSLQDGFIEVLNVIDPFTYSIRCQDCLSLEEISVELKRIIPKCFHLDSDNVNKPNSLVIVEELEGRYYRGYLKYKEEPNIFHISRIDIGDDVCILPRNIYYLPESLFKLRPQKHTIKLYGIIPSSRVTWNKLNDCSIFLKDLIRKASNAKLYEFCLINQSFYGKIEIVTNYNNQLCSICLTDILLEKRIAQPSHNFQLDIITRGKDDQQKLIPDDSFVDKVAEDLKKIEITPQHSVYLNALTGGLLINPDSFANFLLETKTSISNSPVMADENKCDRNKRKEDNKDACLQELSGIGIGHGRSNFLFSQKSGSSGGRGKIKSLLQNLDDKKTTLESQVQPQGGIKSSIPKCEIFERSLASSNEKVNYLESKSNSEATKSLLLNDAENVISSASEINKNIKSEELCFQLLKGRNKKSNSDSRNRKAKHLSQSHKLKSYNHDTLSFSPKQLVNESKFIPNDRILVNSPPLSSNTFSCVNKPFTIKQEPSQPENKNNPLKSLVHHTINNEVDLESKSEANTDCNVGRKNSEFLCESLKASSFNKLSPTSVNSHVLSAEKSIGNSTCVNKSMGRGFLFNKFTKSKIINYDLVNESKSKNFQKSIDNQVLDSEIISQSFQKPNDNDDLACENKSEVLQKSKDELNIHNDIKDSSDHEDRYFDIEEPTYLNFSKKCISLTNKVEKQQNVVKSDDEQYEKLLNAQNNEHEPLDDKAFAKPLAEVKPEGEILEQQILRDYSIGQIPERMKMSCGLIHGNIIANPVSKLSDLKLEQHVFSNLNAKNMRELSRSQMFAVPVLLQRRNLVLVGPPNSGKSLAFVMSFLSLLHDSEYYSSLKPGNGPRCIFVSSCAQNVNYISQFCSAICGAKLTIITTHGGGLELERKEDLTNGCEILVTTPRCLLRLLKHNSVTNLYRVCHIVFDDVDSLLSTFCPEVQEIMSNLSKMLQIRKRYSSLSIQVVLVGEKWTPILEDITFKSLDSPVLCITAHLEAALYARIKPKTYILSPDSKLKKLKELLSLTSNKIRTVIVCRSADEVKSLRPLLELTLSNVLVAHEEMGLNHLVEVGDLWIRCTSPPILLCSDPILTELAVTNAQWLIHYSMPDNKSSFSERFSTIKEHLYDRIKYPKTAPPECQVHILVDDTNELQFPEIISFMKRLNTMIPDLFLEAVKKISVLKEEKKGNMPFCDNLLMFGNCWKKDKCKRQHIFNKSRDSSENLPVKGVMKVKLLFAHNPSHYSVRILATKNSNDDEEWIEFPSNYALIAFKMSNYFSFRENRFAHGRVKIGDLVAIEIEPDLMFKRAKVIDITTRDDKYNPLEVIVHFIDEGSVDKLTASELLHLPPELQIYSQEAYDMYLIGLQPVDYDKSWSFASTLKIQKSISNLNFQEGDNKFFTANIALVTGKNLLATSFLCYEWLDLNKCHVVRFSPKKFILDTGLAEPNPKHFTTLMNLALDAGLISNIAEEFKKCDIDEDGEKVQWAHLDKENTNVVSVISSDSPSCFFLKRLKFSDSLDQLEKELTLLLDSKVTKLDIIERDIVCAARNPDDNRWNRAMVNNVEKDQVEVFFVDYGDCLVLPLSDISRLPKGFITRLPFQAIECSLIGILPLDSEWLPQAVEAFDSMSFNDEHKLKSMFVKVCDVTNATSTMGHHFKVILAPYENKEVYINKEMVYRGFANWDVETKHYLTENIDWTDDLGDYVWDEDGDQNSVEGDNPNQDDGGSDELLQKSEDITSPKENCPANKDLMSMLADNNFEIGNIDSFLELFPPELRHRLKECNVEQALQEYYEFKNSQALQSFNEFKDSQNEEQKTEIQVVRPISYKPEIEEPGTSEVVEGPLLESCGVFHPVVFWSQRDCYVKIKVNLPEIEKYQLDYSDQSLKFSALANEKFYWFEINLFGLICKENVTYASKGLYFEIKMDKVIKGELWPRLVYDDFKYPWIKLDPDDLVEEDDINLIESMFKKGSRFRRTNMMFKSSVISSGIPEPDSDLESVSSKSDNEEFTDLIHDAIDPDSD